MEYLRSIGVTTIAYSKVAVGIKQVLEYIDSNLPEREKIDVEDTISCFNYYPNGDINVNEIFPYESFSNLFWNMV